jgi:outer membrane lipoprotein SlyB
MVKIDNEGSVRDDNQTNKTVQRAAIGTAVGAIIGAIAGGGKGAAIGAIVGAGGGAGSVYVQGRDDLELTRGTELTIRATGPR